VLSGLAQSRYLLVDSSFNIQTTSEPFTSKARQHTKMPVSCHLNTDVILPMQHPYMSQVINGTKAYDSADTV